MKIKLILIDDNGKEFSGELELGPTKSSVLTKSSAKSSTHTIKYSGLKGGIEFLIQNDFLAVLRSAKEVHVELKKENYFHSKESVDKRLRFLVSKKTLTRIRDGNIWKYAIRK